MCATSGSGEFTFVLRVFSSYFQDAEKEKQKSEAKHINLRKRKALSDLFKALASLGITSFVYLLEV